MLCFIRVHRLCLHNVVSSIFTIIIGPAVYFRNIARPVAMTRIDWSGPLQRISPPGIGSSYFPSFKNGIKEIENKQQVHCKHDDGYDGNHLVEILEFIE